MKSIYIFVASFLMLVLTGCQSADDSKLTVGFSQVGAESAWRTAETKSIKDEAKKRGVILKFDDAQNKQENQIRALRSFIAQGVDVIMLAPVVETGWDPVLREAKKVGIPVILLDRSIDTDDDSLYVTHIGPDCTEEGRVAGKWLVDKLGGKGNIIELQGTPGSAPAISRQKGFLEVINANPEMKVIYSQSGDFRRTYGKRVTEAILKQAQGEKITVDAIFGHNDDMAIGAIQAVEDAGLQPGKDVIILSIDGIKDAFLAIKDKKMNCTVECNPLLGPIAFDTVNDILAKKDVEKWRKMSTRYFAQPVGDDIINSRCY